ncbi:hypothetical protein GCM10010166_29600 [Couchioplanes caeruleus subsp. azureus]|nr:hypothetical protein GCM10010166_29600 [Couchioplanes caeruleus subsp. azureus]
MASKECKGCDMASLRSAGTAPLRAGDEDTETHHGKERPVRFGALVTAAGAVRRWVG